MKQVELSPELRPIDGVSFWSITPATLEHLASLLLGSVPGGWVRRGENHARIVGRLGSEPCKIEDELRALTKEATRLLSTQEHNVALRAAVFCHLRFEHIHPLCDANGRIGRVIMALQLQEAYKIPARETLQALFDYQLDYHGAFAAPTPQLKFELLLELLARINGIVLSPDAMKLPASIEPLHRQKVISKNAPPRMGALPFRR